MKNQIYKYFYKFHILRWKWSYNKQILDYAPVNCNVFPLGLNIPFNPVGKYSSDLQQTFKDLLNFTFPE